MPRPSSAEPFASRADAAACRAMLRGGSKTFFAASLALPASVRSPAVALYAFCRMADDAVDEGTDENQAVARLHARLDRIYAGAPADIPADRAFADVVERFAIPKCYPLALLEGFAWDGENRRYADLSALKAYGVRVAGTVGAMMALVMGVRERALVARACDLGVAMQLTNIARDVGEDARRGRLYLPLDWLEHAGIDPERWLARPEWSPALGGVIARVLAAAEALYSRSDAGLAQLPAACRPGMHAARLLYAEIGHEVARRTYDSVSQRAVVSWQRKARLIAWALRDALREAMLPPTPFMEEAAFLLEMLPAVSVPPHAPVSAAPLPRGPDLTPAETVRERARWPRIEDRVVWVVELFERLERRERALSGAQTS